MINFRQPPPSVSPCLNLRVSVRGVFWPDLILPGVAGGAYGEVGELGVSLVN